MKFLIKYPLTVLSIFWILEACVPARSLEEAKQKEKKCNDELNGVKADVVNCKTKLTEFEQENEQIKRKLSSLENDTLVLGKTLRITIVEKQRTHKREFRRQQEVDDQPSVISGAIAARTGCSETAQDRP
jgi:chromosome segregation ATPase